MVNCVHSSVVVATTIIVSLLLPSIKARVPLIFTGDTIGNLRSNVYTLAENDPGSQLDAISGGRTSCVDVGWSDSNCVVGPFSSDKEIPESVFREVCRKTRGKFAVPESTSLYVVCHGPYLTINQCPRNSRFHAEEGECSEPSRDEVTSPDSRSPDPERKESEDERENRQVQQDTKTGKKVGIFNDPTPQSLVVPIIGSSEYIKRSEVAPPSFQLQAPALFQERNLCRHGKSIFPHPSSCQNFVQCASGQQFIKSCPRGTVFNPELSICDWPYNVPECDTPDIDNSLYTQRHSRFDALVKLTNSIETSSPTRDYRATTDAEECDENDYITLHEHCNKYIICENGRRHVRICPPGTNFDPINKGCDHIANVDCSSRLSDFGTYACNKGMKYSAPHPDFCNKFIECENGKLFVKHCGGDLVYNPFINACDYKTQVQCKSPISLENDIDVNFTGRETRKSLSNSLCNTPDLNQRYRIVEEGLERYPHPIFCNKFVECENGRRFQKDCGPGTYYDKVKGWCGFANNTREAIRDSCDSYAECQGSLYQEIKCPSGTYYEAQEKMCIRGDKCPQRQEIIGTTATPTEPAPTFPITTDIPTEAVVYYQIQPSLPSKTASFSGCNISDLDERYRIVDGRLQRYPHPTYCNKFVECENGRRFVKNCGPGTYYDKISGWCGYAHDTREAIPNSCFSYAECHGSQFKEIKCPGGSYFNPQKKQCIKGHRCPYIQQTSPAPTTFAPSSTLPTTRMTTTRTTIPTKTTIMTTTTPTTTTFASYDYDELQEIKQS